MKQLRHTHKSPRRSKVRFVGASAAVILFVACGFAYHELTHPLTHGQLTRPVSRNFSQPRIPSDPSRTTILLMGTDTRPGDTGGNSDVMVLCSIDRDNQRIELLSIPRDTKVQFPDGHYAKINQAMQIGGPPLVESLVEKLVDEPIDNYALTHFGGLVNIINTIGGVTVNVPERMYYNTGDSQYNIINLRKGTQTLTGQQALGFVRFRHDALGDIGRTERQQEFLTALGHQMLKPASIPRLPAIARECWSTVDTDMNLLEVMSLCARATKYENYTIIHETLPGSFHDPNPQVPGDQSYWIVNPDQAKYVAKNLFVRGNVQENPIQDPSLTEHWTTPSPKQAPQLNTRKATTPHPIVLS